MKLITPSLAVAALLLGCAALAQASDDYDSNGYNSEDARYEYGNNEYDSNEYSGSEYSSEYSDSEPQALMEQAPGDLITDLTAICKDWALADSIEESQQPAYVLQCVNEELQSQGYQAVASVAL
jgi:antirestriction protein